MRLGEIDFPGPLVEAQRRGSLVVFAGAGVSVPPPSNLPDFEKLSDALAAGTLELLKDEPIDRFLGRLFDKNPGLHARARELLSRPDSQHNQLHLNLLRLFSNSASIRIVTTNFDNHFAAAAAEAFPGQAPEMYFAPALPLGGDFTGIVHLHGSVTLDARRMVLTDKDFGRAYLTEGWARRFLIALFLQYDVLFVGYSHSDPLMHHLARGLPPSGAHKRFVLAEQGNDAFWEGLGIHFIPYAKGHGDLGPSLLKWAERVWLKPLEHEERIKRIVTNPDFPPPAGEDLDYIESALDDLSLTRHFVRFADRLVCLEWIAKRDTFLRLFQDGRTSGEHDWVLAWWFAEKFACDRPGAALDLVRRNGSRLSPLCWRAIVTAVFNRTVTNPKRAHLDKWIPILIQNHPAGVREQFLGYILERCRHPEDSTSALLLIRHLLKPILRFAPGTSPKILSAGAEPDNDVELETIGEQSFLHQAWLKFFQPNIGQFGDQLAAIVGAHLEEAALLHRAYGNDHGSWDPISLDFPKLDRPVSSSRYRGLSLLVEIARDSLLWLVAEQPEQARAFITLWQSSVSLTLRRLAVFGVAKVGWSPDEKLQWLLQREMVFSPGVSEEVQLVLESAFRDASETVKEEILAKVIGGGADTTDEDHDWFAYQVLLELQQAEPENPRVVAEISSLLLRRPDLATHISSADSGFVPPELRTPYVARELLGRSAEEVAVLLSTFKPDSSDPHAPTAFGFARQLCQAVQTDPEWGIAVGGALCARGVWTADWWKAIVEGLIQSTPTFDQLTSGLDLLLRSHEAVKAAPDAVAFLLERAIAKDTKNVPDTFVDIVVKVASLAWPVLISQQRRPREQANDWLFVAINDPAGTLTQAEVRALTVIRARAGELWTGIPDDFQVRFSALLHDSSWAAEMAKIVLASQIYTLFRLDPTWVLNNLLVLFDWDLDERRALQCWHGYVVWGDWDDDFLNAFLPYYKKTFGRLGMFSEPKLRRSFCEHMAAIALFSAVHPLESNWLRDFIRTIETKDCALWTQSVAVMLEQVAVDQKQALWDQRLKPYWKERLQGPLPPLSAEEVRAMVSWAFKLGPAFREAVLLILTGPPHQSLRSDPTPYLEMQGANVCTEHPRESATLLRWLVKNEKRLLTYPDPIYEMARELARKGAPSEVLVDLCQDLARLGHSGAAELRQVVESRPVP